MSITLWCSVQPLGGGITKWAFSSGGSLGCPLLCLEMNYRHIRSTILYNLFDTSALKRDLFRTHFLQHGATFFVFIMEKSQSAFLYLNLFGGKEGVKKATTKKK